MSKLDDVTAWLDLIPRQHRNKPKFMAWLKAMLNVAWDAKDFNRQVAEAFDIDTAVGVQLDIIGEWIGLSRAVPVPLTGVYFTFNTGPGFNSGILRGPYDPLTGLESLYDDRYRTVLRARIKYNHWNGSIPAAVDGMASAFPGTQLIIQTAHDTTMIYGLYGPLTAIDKALFNAGYFDFKPAGVGMTRHFSTTSKVFAFNTSGGATAGFNNGVFAL